MGYNRELPSQPVDGALSPKEATPCAKCEIGLGSWNFTQSDEESS